MRHEAFRVAAEVHGIEVVDHSAVDAPGDRAQRLSELVVGGATAVAAYNDEVALTVVAAAARAGIRVPEELAVIGIDDIPLAALSFPSLTTVSLVPADAPGLEQTVDRIVRGEDLGPSPAPTPRVVHRESA